MRRRPGLVLLTYLANLIVAAVLAVPAYVALREGIDNTGFSEQLARGFDFVLWVELWVAVGAALRAVAWQVFWMLPVYAFWKAALGVGLTHALAGEHDGAFWPAVGQYTLRGALVALMIGGPILVLVLIVLAVSSVIAALLGSVGAFWVGFVAGPALVVALFAIGDLMVDYAYCALVLGDSTVREAWGEGLTFPFRHGVSSRVHVLWFTLAGLLWLLPFVLDIQFGPYTSPGFWALLSLQQIVLFARNAVTVAWTGSVVSVFEGVEHSFVADVAG
ncbi:MAG: hypothetical protein AAGI08_15660 [Bacteroidota bacterium]